MKSALVLVRRRPSRRSLLALPVLTFAATLLPPAEAHAQSNPVPSLTSIAPAAAFAGGPALILDVNGSSFVSGAQVTFGGTPVPAVYVSSAYLRASVPASLIAIAGNYPVVVTNPAPGGGSSPARTFVVNPGNPLPVLASVTPAVIAVGSPATSVTIDGSGFIFGSVVRANGADLTTTYVSPTRLIGALPASLLATTANLPITVFTPAPGGGTSTARPLVVGNPVPVLASFTPRTVLAGSASSVMTVFGDGFISTSRARVGGTAMATTYVSRNQLIAVVDAAIVATPRTIGVIIENPGPGGGLSGALPLTVLAEPAPLPVLSAIAPTSAAVGFAGGNITVTGSAFSPSSRVFADGTALATTYFSATQLVAAAPASLFTTARTISFTVTTPAPGGGTSAARTFDVTNPAPVLATVAPALITSGADVALTITGSGFVTGSQARFAGVALATSFAGAAQLTAIVPAALLQTAGSFAVTVFNAAPGGGTSGSFLVTVQAACPSGCDDANPCTADACGVAGCTHTAVPDGPFAGSTPTSCGVGACTATGQTICSGGAVVDACTPGQALAPLDENCDGIDDDCDGTADEDYLSETTQCGVGACARTGHTFCAASLVGDDCTPGQAAANDATCDGVDDDCDGVTDEDYVSAVTSCGTEPCTGHGMTSCVAGSVQEGSCTPRVEGTQCRLLADLRPGRPKPWEDTYLWHDEGAMALSPGGNIQQRIPLFNWQPPGVGPPISLVLYHNSADSSRQLGFGLGFRIAATLSPRGDGSVLIEDQDGTPRIFIPDGAGGYASELFDPTILRREGSDYVLRAPGGFERVFQMSNALGYVERFRRDRTGDTVSFDYDAANHLVRAGDAVGREALFHFSGGFCTSAVDPEGRVLDFSYDQGRLSRIEGPAVQGARPRVDLGYDGASGRMSSRTSLGQVSATTFTYDAAGRIASFTLQPIGSTTRIDYTDGQVAVSDSTRRVYIQKFARGAVIASISPTGLTSLVARDAALRPVLVIDGNGRRTAYAYNTQHDMTSFRDEAGRTTTYTYDARHNVLTETDPYGDTTRHTYNAFDAPLSDTNARLETTSYQYDAAGNLTAVTDFAGVIRMQATYNSFGKPLTLTGAEGITAERTYDGYGNLASLTIPGLPTIHRTATPLNQTLSYTNPWGETRTFGYDARGRVTSIPFGAGSASISLDVEGRVIGTQTSVGGHSEQSSVSYTGFSPTALSLNGVTLESAPATHPAPPLPPAATCTPACGLRCGSGIGDTCGGLIDCACDPALTCNAAGSCVE